MGYGDALYEAVAGGSQTLNAGTRTLFACTGASQWVKHFPQQRWNSATSSVIGMSQDEKLDIRFTSTYTPTTILSFAPFALKWEFDIGGSFGTIATDWWDYPSLLGVTLLTAAPRTKSSVLPFYVGQTWMANGCKIYVTAVGSGCTLANNALLISRTG